MTRTFPAFFSLFEAVLQGYISFHGFAAARANLNDAENKKQYVIRYISWL